MIRNRKNNENRRKKRLADLEASGKTARTKKSKFQKKEKQLQTSTGENELLYDPPSDSNGEFLHNDSNGDSLSGIGFDFSEYDNKENDYTNFSKGNAYILFIISYLELLL